MTDTAAFDLVTAFDAIHDQSQPDAVLRHVRRALRPDGLFLMQDISGSGHLHHDCKHPVGPFLYTISCMHCMSVSLAGGGPGPRRNVGAKKKPGNARDGRFRQRSASKHSTTTR